jgi:hypothetical protein
MRISEGVFIYIDKLNDERLESSLQSGIESVA